MPLNYFGPQPSDKAAIWRFLDMKKFRDLMANEELYFCRADLFNQDPNEGSPQDEWLRAVLGIRRGFLADEIKLRNAKGDLSQFRESSFISCWHLFEGEDPAMWKDFAPYGVAICSRYGLLKRALKRFIDPIQIGVTVYHAPQRYNTFHFIFSKGSGFTTEKEVRIVLSSYDPVAGNNRHYGRNGATYERPQDENRLHPWVMAGKRRRVDLKALITKVVVSPWASAKIYDEIGVWKNCKSGATFQITRSTLKSTLLLSPKRLAKVKL